MKIPIIRLSWFSIEDKDNLKVGMFSVFSAIFSVFKKTVGIMYSDVLDIILVAQLLNDKSGVVYSTEPGRWINQGRPEVLAATSRSNASRSFLLGLSYVCWLRSNTTSNSGKF